MNMYVFIVIFFALSCNAADFHQEDLKSFDTGDESISRTDSPSPVAGLRRAMIVDWDDYHAQAGTTVADPLNTSTSAKPIYDLSDALKGRPKQPGLRKLLGNRFRTNQPQKDVAVPQQNGLNEDVKK